MLKSGEYMENIKVGDKLEIHCYKHNGKLHRQWDEAVVLDVKDEYIVFGNNRTTVVDSDGKVWRTKEPAILFFYKDRWFNIIGQLKDYGVYFYCNIATPALIDDNTPDFLNPLNTNHLQSLASTYNRYTLRSLSLIDMYLNHPVLYND